MASTRSTRQLLGELDALMDQMLSLPVEEGTRIAAAKPPQPVSPPREPLHPLAVTMTLLDEPPGATVAASSPALAAAPKVDDPIETPSVEFPEPNEPPVGDESFWVQEADLVPDPSPRPTANRGRTALVPTRPLIREVPPIAPLPSRPIQRTYAWALRIQRALVRRTYGLGFVGRLLRSDLGCNILGVLGILMLLIAAFWLAKDLLHWT